MGIEIVGHRGASGEAPENTMAAIHLAWRQQADAVEIDARLTRDGRIVAFHDESTLRITRKEHAVSLLTLDQLRLLDAGLWKGEEWAEERIPTLEEVLATVPTGKRLYVEIKCGPEIIPALVKLLQTPLALERVVVISYGFDVLAELKRRLPAVVVLQILRLSKSPRKPQEATPTLAERILPAREAGFDGFDLGITHLLEAETVSRLLAENFRLCTWTINDVHEAQRLALMGVQAVTTDYPARLRHELSTLIASAGILGQTPEAGDAPAVL